MDDKFANYFAVQPVAYRQYFNDGSISFFDFAVQRGELPALVRKVVHGEVRGITFRLGNGQLCHLRRR